MRFGLNSHLPDLSKDVASSPSGVYRRLCNLRLSFDLVLLRFALHVVFVERAQDGSGCKGFWEGFWAVVWAEHRCRRDSVRRCCQLNVNTCSDLWFKATQKHRSQSTARSSKRMSTRHHIHPSNLLVPAGCQDGEDVGNPVNYDTIKVCDPFSSFHVRSIGVHESVVS